MTENLVARNDVFICSDPQLLNILFEDMEKADTLWQPGPYWKGYVEHNKKIVQKEDALSNFRNTNLKGFSVTKPGAQLNSKRLEWLLNMIKHLPFLEKISTAIYNELSVLNNTYSSYLQRLQYTMYHYAKVLDKEGFILRIQDSGLGNPFDLFYIDRRKYTINFIRKHLHYLYVKERIDFNQVKTILEIGGGYGAQTEVILQIHPNIKYILIDIPPQIYVAECYLKALYPGKVLGYKETKQQHYLDIYKWNDKGIFILAPWQVPNISSKVDLVWNCASFQEMTQQIVENYLQHVRKLACPLYLCTLEKGHKQFRNISAEFFRNKLLKDFLLIDERPADDIIGDSINRYMHMLFKIR